MPEFILLVTLLIGRSGSFEDDLPQGFRSTFRVWAGEKTHTPHAVIEGAIRHAVGKVERAYRRTDVLAKRRELMTAWANHCEQTAPGNAHRLPMVRSA